MMTLKTIFSATLVSSALILAGCGGSGTDNTVTQVTATTPQQPPVSSLPALLSGNVSSFSGNQLTINERTLDISGVSIRYGDTTVSRSALIRDMKVLVRTDGAKVTAVELNPDISGRVTSTAGTQIEVNTLSVDVAALQTAPRVGDYVAISTAVGASEQLSAKALAVLNGSEIPATIELEGAVQQLTASQQRFVLNGLIVDYAQSRRVPANLANGSWVEVYGSLSGQTLLAYDIEAERYADIAEAEITGTITWVDSQQQRFELNQNLSFTVLTSTRFEDGRQQDLAPGRIVEVTSRFVNNEAELVEVDFQSETADSAVVSKLDRRFAVTGRVQLQGDTLLFNGFVFQLISNTKLDDGLTLTRLDGESLELEGVQRNGQLQILEIERADNESRVDFKGLVTQGTIWGYQADDQSLTPFEGQWVEVECAIQGERLSACRLDG